MSKIFVVSVAFLLFSVVSISPALADHDHASRLGAFRELRALGVSAYSQGNFATAESEFRSAAELYPAHPVVLILLARSAMRAGHIDIATAALSRYVGLGFYVDVRTDPVLAEIVHQSDDLPAKLLRNLQPAGRLSRVAMTSNQPLLLEEIAFGRRSTLLMGAVHTPGIYKFAKNGSLEPFSPPNALSGIFGMQADPARGALWVATSSPSQVENPPYHEAELVRLNLDSGAIKARFVVPSPGQHQWGDLAVASDGTIYASDAVSGEIWQLKPSSLGLSLLAPSGSMGSPQGIVVSPLGNKLIVADYSTGLHLIDRKTGADQLFPIPQTLSLVGTDALITDGNNKIYAVQNGAVPQRLMELTVDRNWTRVVRSRVLAANLPDLDQPTGAIIRKNYLYFVATSQWSEFDDDGALMKGHDSPAIVDKLELDRH